MKRTKGLVSILAINMNQNHVTAEFLMSLHNSTYKKIEVIIVDQNSTEDPEELFKSAYPEVIFVKNEINNGFTGGNNTALEHSTGEFIFCVNNDTIITATLIERLVRPLLHDTCIGIVSPKIVYNENKNLIQYAGYTEINPYTGRNSCPGKGKDNILSDCYKFSQSYQTAYAHGCAMMIPYNVIEQAGGFLDDEYFIYYEELDFSQRVKDLGYIIWYQGDATIFHKESITTGKNSVFKEYYHTRNRILFMRKHNNIGISLFVYSIYLLCLIVPKKIIQYLPTRKFKHLQAMFKGIIWNIKDFFTKNNTNIS